MNNRKDDDKKRKREYRDIDDLMEDVFKDFFERPMRLSDILEEFNKMIQRFFSDLQKTERELFGEHKPLKRYTWGFSIVIPPTGPPLIQPFGNVRTSKEPEEKKVEIRRSEEYEPLATVYEEDGNVRVIVDLPGAEEDKINVDATESKVVIRAEGAGRKYYKEIELPKKVKPKPVKASFKNGILELEFEEKR
ncbi:MAG: Hsp20 family protein [Crenarchaeota archaeon]|nr:Hsp20 family protein [Thermoproteota archaeon]MCR8454545.1 Hsp20 family protein [Thermoproteota archaeon]MCR8455019.1 Hsp20 family protein [Thermoproteota archaeon]MCR8463259.1 Hsp20 family protein [Thermoproteota archaeon]MCR8470467.1 Hsp20 family protein [Thermoproteota archaeon]